MDDRYFAEVSSSLKPLLPNRVSLLYPADCEAPKVIQSGKALLDILDGYVNHRDMILMLESRKDLLASLNQGGSSKLKLAVALGTGAVIGHVLTRKAAVKPRTRYVDYSPVQRSEDNSFWMWYWFILCMVLITRERRAEQAENVAAP